MKKALCVLTMCGALICGKVSAHAEHGVISAHQAINIATTSVHKMTLKDFGFEVGKLEASWKTQKSLKASVIHVEENFYIVSATNSALGNTIFFKITNNGLVLDVTRKNQY